MFDKRALASVLCLSSVFACAGCSTAPSQTTTADDEPTYVPTGSRIPRKVSAGADRGVGTMNSQQAQDVLSKPAAATAVGR